MTIPSIVNFIFNPRIVEEYVELINDDTLSSLDTPFPFASTEYQAIRWHLQFATTACAYHLLEDGKEAVLRELTTRIGQQQDEVRVGDYVNAKGEISKVRGPLGPRGWLLPITDRRIPLRIISATLVNVKLEFMLNLFAIAEKNTLTLDWSDYKQIADEYAFYTLVSYWGREPDEQNDSGHLEGLSDLIYEHIIRLRDLIKGTSPELL